MPFQIPPVAESHCKFRLWNCLSNSQNIETADGNVPFQIPAAVSRFKFRRSDGLSLIKPPLSAELHKAIINIKRLRRQAVAAIYIIVKFSKAVRLVERYADG